MQDFTDSRKSSTSRKSFSAGYEFSKSVDDTLSQSVVTSLSVKMKSVCAIVRRGRTVGTAFRVGDECIMTAFHVVRTITRPDENKPEDCSLLEVNEVYVNFNESIGSPPQVVYRLKKEFYREEALDVAVLKIANPINLPDALALCKSDINSLKITDVSFVGYGHPGQPDKTLDPRCYFVSPNSQRIQAVQVWLRQNAQYYQNALGAVGKDKNLVNLGYGVYDSNKILFDCYLEQGGSGSPALTNNNADSIQVVGLLTHGLPEFYFHLPKLVKGNFPPECRFEMGTKMQYVYEAMVKADPQLAQTLFG